MHFPCFVFTERFVGIFVVALQREFGEIFRKRPGYDGCFYHIAMDVKFDRGVCGRGVKRAQSAGVREAKKGRKKRENSEYASKFHLQALCENLRRFA